MLYPNKLTSLRGPLVILFQDNRIVNVYNIKILMRFFVINKHVINIINLVIGMLISTGFTSHVTIPCTVSKILTLFVSVALRKRYTIEGNN